MFLCTLFNERNNCQYILLCVLVFPHMYFTFLFLRQTFQLYFQLKAPISPYVDQGLIVLQWSDEKREFIFVSSLFPQAHCSKSASDDIVKNSIRSRVIWAIKMIFHFQKILCYFLSAVNLYHMLYLAAVCCVLSRESVNSFTNNCLLCTLIFTF